AVKLRVGKKSGSACVVDDVEVELVIVVAHTGAAPNDLLEVGHGVNDTGQNHIPAGRNVNARGQHLRGGHQGRDEHLHIHEAVKVSAPDRSLIRHDPRNVVGVVFGDIRVAVVEGLTPVLGMFLVHAEDDCLGET